MGGLCAKICPCIFAEGVGLIGRPIRLPKETYAVPGTAVEIVAHCKYDVTEEQVEWSRVIISKGKEKEEKIFGADVKKPFGKVTISEGNTITLNLTKFGPKDGGKYTITLTKEDPEAEKDTATTELIVEDPKREKKIRAMFNEIDKDKSGEITNEELANALRKANPGLEEEDVKMMIKESDENGDGVVEYHEFSMFMRKAGL